MRHDLIHRVASRYLKGTEEVSDLVDNRGQVHKLPGYLYHVTYLKDLDQIQSRGLRAGSGQTFGGGYTGHSTGRIFLTDGEGGAFWMERYAVMAGNNTDNPEEGWWPIMLRVPTARIEGTLGYDEAGSKDARSLSVYVEGGDIPPRSLECYDGDSWVPLKSIDTEELLDRAKEEGAEEDGWDNETWWDVDFEFFEPPHSSL